MIYLQASINEANVASSFLRRAEAGDVTLCVSRQMIAEIRDVLTRTEIRAKNALLSDEELANFILRIEENAAIIDPLRPTFILSATRTTNSS